MRSFEVRVTPSAMAQTWDAVRYVRDELCMPQAAARLLDEIEEAVSSLSSTCQTGSMRFGLSRFSRRESVA